MGLGRDTTASYSQSLPSTRNSAHTTNGDGVHARGLLRGVWACAAVWLTRWRRALVRLSKVSHLPWYTDDHFNVVHGTSIAQRGKPRTSAPASLLGGEGCPLGSVNRSLVDPPRALTGAGRFVVFSGPSRIYACRPAASPLFFTVLLWFVVVFFAFSLLICVDLAGRADVWRALAPSILRMFILE